MTNNELKALVNGLIAYCQRHDMLSTDTNTLADDLQDFASSECYISKQELVCFLES